MTTTAIFGQSAKDTGSVASNPTRLVNLWLDNAGEGGRTGFVMRSVLGLQAYADAGEILIRDLFEADGAIYAIAADGLFKIGTGRLGTVASGEQPQRLGDYGCCRRALLHLGRLGAERAFGAVYKLRIGVVSGRSDASDRAGRIADLLVGHRRAKHAQRGQRRNGGIAR